MSVVNGQPVNAAVTNAAFVSKTDLTGNDVTGIINLNNGTSGGNITNLQQTVNNKVTGAGTVVDNAVPKFNGTTGALIEQTGVIIDDSDNVTGVTTLKLGAGAIDDDAILDATSTTKGVLLPRLTTVQRDAIVTPTTSLLIFNTTDNEYQYYDGASWASIGGGGGVGFQETPSGTVNGVNDTFGPLSFLPSSDESVIVYVDGIAQVITTAWTISGSTITFQPGYIPITGQDVYVFYLTEGSPSVPVMSGTYRTEYRTLTSGEASAEQITLAFTPATPSYVSLDVIGGGPQFFSDDFTVSGAILSWSGLGLDGVLVTGDKLRIIYVE